LPFETGSMFESGGGPGQRAAGACTPPPLLSVFKPPPPWAERHQTRVPNNNGALGGAALSAVGPQQQTVSGFSQPPLLCFRLIPAGLAPSPPPSLVASLGPHKPHASPFPKTLRHTHAQRGRGGLGNGGLCAPFSLDNPLFIDQKRSSHSACSPPSLSSSLCCLLRPASLRSRPSPVCPTPLALPAQSLTHSHAAPLAGAAAKSGGPCGAARSRTAPRHCARLAPLCPVSARLFPPER
jgi:hypothetical protein